MSELEVLNRKVMNPRVRAADLKRHRQDIVRLKREIKKLKADFKKKHPGPNVPK